MRKLLSRRPSAAMVVAIIAVILAVGGTAAAALNKKDKKKVRNIADQEISKQAPSLSVASAANAANATKAANADTLGGVGPGGFTQGAGHNYFGAKTGDNPSSNNSLLSIPGIGNITFNCAANGVDSTVTISNTSGSFLGDVGQTQDSNGATLDPLGPNISNGSSVTLTPHRRRQHGRGHDAAALERPEWQGGVNSKSRTCSACTARRRAPTSN